MARRVVHFETIRSVNEGAMRYPVFKNRVFRIFDLDIWPYCPSIRFLLNVPIAGTTARRLVHLETIRSVNEGAMRYPVFKNRVFRIFDLDLWPYYPSIRFLLNVPIAGTMARRLVHFETIRSVNEGAMRYPVFKNRVFRIFDLDLWPNYPSIRLLLNMPIAGTSARRVVYFETIRSVNEGAMRYPVFKNRIFCIFDLDHWPFYPSIRFLLNVPIAGTSARRLVHFETIRSVNEGAMRYPVF